MHNASTKQRLAALRRKLGIHLTPPKWARARSERFKAARAAMKAAQELVAAMTPAPSQTFAVAGGPGGSRSGDEPTTLADAPYPSQHLSATDASRLPARGSGDGGAGGGGPGRSLRWLWILAAAAIAVGLVARYTACSRPEVATPPAPPAPTPPPVVAPPPQPPPPPAPTAPAPRRVTVVRGDCLWRLSATHLGDPTAWRRLFDSNRRAIRNPDRIYPGQILELPVQ